MGASSYGITSGWKCCDTCNGFYSSSSGNACLGGGNTHSNSNGLSGGVAQGSIPGWQDNWRICKKCGTLFYYGSPTNGSCFKGGAHDYVSTNGYSLKMRSASADTVMQPCYWNMWRWCKKCESLFTANSGNGKAGSCPAGGSHDASKSNYYSIEWTY